jgi:hypothetical protein
MLLLEDSRRLASISFMDDAGIDFAVVSLSTPGVYTGDSRPERFGGFACLPLPGVDASLEELSCALDVLAPGPDQ